MRNVIEQHMTRIAHKTQAEPEEIEKLKRCLSKHADQSFLWVKLIFDILDGERRAFYWSSGLPKHSYWGTTALPGDILTFAS